MQNWTGCKKLTISTTENYENEDTSVDLLDTRNNVTYRVRRYSDQNCWMTQNLALTPGLDTPIENVTTGTLTTTTADSQAAGNISFVSSFNDSYTSAEARFDISNDSPSTNTGYYSWSAAILACPSGWTLPASGDWRYFLYKEDLIGKPTKLRSAPYSFDYTGMYYGSSFSYNSAGNGLYWSSTGNGSLNAYDFYFASTTMAEINSSIRRSGLAVRCFQNDAPSSTYMQDFSIAECANLVTSTTENYSNIDTYAARIDTRNNVSYTIRKFSDGYCWMTENLRATPGTSDPKNNIVDSGALPTSTSASYDIVFANSGFSYYGAGTTGLLAYYGGNTVYGAYYTWSAAQRVCPAGWILPSNTTYTNFISNENIGSGNTGVAKLTSDPYNFTPAGAFNGSSLSNAGNSGYYWTSQAQSNQNAYQLYFESGASVNYSSKYNGKTVRCIHASS